MLADVHNNRRVFYTPEERAFNHPMSEHSGVIDADGIRCRTATC